MLCPGQIFFGTIYAEDPGTQGDPTPGGSHRGGGCPGTADTGTADHTTL